MAYATLDNLLELQPREVLLQLADDDADGEFVESPPNAAWRNAASAAADASSLVDFYIASRVSLPLSPPYPELIVQIASNLALCMLYDRRRELDVPEGIKDRRERYMALLREIKEGDADVPGLPDGPDGLGAGFARVSAPPREFTRGLLARL